MRKVLPFLLIVIAIEFFVVPVIFSPFINKALAAADSGVIVEVKAKAADSTSDTGSIPNPLGTGVDDPRKIVGNVIKAMLGIVGSLALLMFIYGGFMWVTSAGNDEKVKKGKDMIVWASLGLIVVFFAYVLVKFVIGAIKGA